MAYTVTTVRLTTDNIATAFRPGDRFTDDPDFGIITDAFRYGEHDGYVITDRDSDRIGLPQTVRLTRVVI